MTSTSFDQGMAGNGADEVSDIFKRCVQCGLCNATCPTFVLYGDERDGPRGRIALMREIFETRQVSDADGWSRIDRCLSCLSCMTTCPSGVDFQHLVNRARTVLHTSVPRSLQERLARWLIHAVLPHPDRLRWVLRIAPMGRRLRSVLKMLGLRQLSAMADVAPPVLSRRAAKFSGAGTAQITGRRRARVLLLAGCVQKVIRPDINDATIRLLARGGVEVEVVAGAGCCGGIAQQLGREADTIAHAMHNVDAWWKAMQREPVDAIIANTSGCGTTVRDYARLLKGVEGYEERAAAVAEKALDATAFLANFDLGPPVRWSSIRVGILGDCGLLHGQRIADQPKGLIKKAGFSVIDVPEAHICCGAAGAFSMLQPTIAGELAQRKATLIRQVRPDLVATGNIGCITHLARGSEYPVVHTVELLDWAHGGPVPRGLDGFEAYMNDVPLRSTLKPEDYLEPVAAGEVPERERVGA